MRKRTALWFNSITAPVSCSSICSSSGPPLSGGNVSLDKRCSFPTSDPLRLDTCVQQLHAITWVWNQARKDAKGQEAKAAHICESRWAAR